ncbi:unnamed protein product [Urochloa decumbens]|uniref:Uncharacterized protein n=1 Tax=Urochloa decumbens TaxID=240449 RepID=A0ABC8XZ77_9POAL
MAEFLPTILQSIFSKITGKSVTTLADSWNIEEKFKAFQLKILTLTSLLEDKENISWRRPTMKKLVKKAYAVIEEADEVVEDFKYDAEYADVQIGMSWKEKALMSVNQNKPFLGSIILSQKLNSVLKKLIELETDLRVAGLVEHPMPPEDSFRQSTSLVDSFMEIVGRDDATDSIVKLLLDQENQQRIQVLPIMGIGGIGKTTLAKVVYNDLRVDNHFAVKVWYYCSNRCDVCAVLKSVIESITEKKWEESNDFQCLQKGLGKAILQRRLLLVLDDYACTDSDSSERERELKSTLSSYSGPGSCILLTSRGVPLTSTFGTLKPCNLQSLSEEDSWKIFSSRAFSNGLQENPKFVALGRDIVKMCKGQRPSTCCDAFNCRKQCFVLASLFPKGSEIDTEKLIQLWAANSYLGEEQGKNVYEKGRQVLSSFIAKGFLQDSKITRIVGTFEALTVKMHDFLHDLAKSVTDECATIEDLLAKKTSVEDVRHLLIDISAFGNDRTESLLRGMKSVRTSIIATDLDTCWNNHDDMGQHRKQLRLRSLRALQCGYAPRIHRHLVCSLHLRYLDLSYLPVVTLPDSLCRLYNLQTLRVAYCILLACLPEGLANLRQLQHIYNLGCYLLDWMPPNLSQLTSLCTLTVFAVSDEDGRGIEELAELNELSNKLELWHLERVECGSRAKRAKLWRKTRVTDLSLRDVMTALEPHENLSSFALIGYGGSTTARWARAPSHFQCLKRLCIVKCRWLDEIPAVWFLCTLEELILIDMGCLGTLSLVTSRGDSNTPLNIFPGLRKMFLCALPMLENWAGNHAGSYNGPIILPKLEDLVMRHCNLVKNIPQCPVLKKVEATACCHLDFIKLEQLSLLQEINYACAERPIFHMHIDSWPSLRTLKLSDLLNMQLLPPKSHPSSQRDVVLRSDHLLCKLQPGQSYEHEIVLDSQAVAEEKSELDNLEIVEKCFKNLEHLWLTSNSFSGLSILTEEILQLWTCFNHVKSLRIMAKDIVYWPVEVGLLSSLQKLHVEECTRLTELQSDNDIVLPPNLMELIIEECHCLVKLPKLPCFLEVLDASLFVTAKHGIKKLLQVLRGCIRIKLARWLLLANTLLLLDDLLDVRIKALCSAAFLPL